MTTSRGNSVSRFTAIVATACPFNLNCGVMDPKVFLECLDRLFQETVGLWWLGHNQMDGECSIGLSLIHI